MRYEEIIDRVRQRVAMAVLGEATGGALDELRSDLHPRRKPSSPACRDRRVTADVG